MSTYHQLRDGTAYPAVMLVHGMNDPRVDVWQSAKTAARLQQATASGKPVFMRIDMQAGHGVGSTAQQAASQLGDVYARDAQPASDRTPLPAEWNACVGHYRSFGSLVTNFRIFARRGQLWRQM